MTLINKFLILVMLNSVGFAEFSIQSSPEDILLEKFSLGDAQEKESALIELNKINSAYSNFLLGVYFEGVNIKKSIHFYQKAIKLGDIKSLHNLGIIELKNGNFEKAKSYLLKSVDSGTDRDLLILFDITKDEKYLNLALEKSVPYAYGSAAKYFFEKYNIDKNSEYIYYIEKAYKLKESFIEYYYVFNDMVALKDGVNSKDYPSVEIFTGMLLKEEKYNEVIELTNNMPGSYKILFNRAAAFAKLGDFRNARINLNDAKEIYSDDKTEALESFICSNANVCRDF